MVMSVGRLSRVPKDSLMGQLGGTQGFKCRIFLCAETNEVFGMIFAIAISSQYTSAIFQNLSYSSSQKRALATTYPHAAYAEYPFGSQ